MRSGAGPRHIAFHPTRAVAWILNELDSTITSCRWDGRWGILMLFEVTSALPGDFTGDNQTAEIEFVAASRTLYLSNRGHDSVAMFRVNRTTGMPRSIGWKPIGGKDPRLFVLDPGGRSLYVANLSSDTIRCFHMDERTGALSTTHEILKAPSPCAIAFVSSD